MRIELKRLQQQIGVTTIYVTHDQSEALDMSDRIAVISGGRIVQMGAPRDIYFRPQNAFVASFVGATNLVRGTVDDAASPNGVAPVVLEDGQVLRCLFPHQAARADRTAVSIRPESLTLCAPSAPAPEGWNRMEGVVASQGFLGNMNRYGIRVGQAVMHANTGPETMFPVGAAVGLHFPYDSAVAILE
jgi:iron(III) transport system ATP-binding protein